MRKISDKKKAFSSRKARDDIMTFFENLMTRRFSDAEKAIEVIRDKRFGDTQFKEGYVKALEGMLLSLRTGDDRDFINRAKFDEKFMKKYKEDFREILKKGIRSPFDMGFFSAWSDLIQYWINVEK